MKRWFVCRMGAYSPEEPDVRAPKVAQYTPNWRAWSIGHKGWCLGQCAAADFTAMLADSQIFILPDATLDAAWSSLPNNVRNQVANRLGQAGFATNGIQNNMSVRQVLVYVLQQIQPGLNGVEGDVVDIEQ